MHDVSVSAVQRHAAAPWRAWQSVIPSLMTITNSPDTDSLFHSTPISRAQLTQLQSTISQQMNKPTFLHKPLGSALRLQTTQKKQVSTIQRNILKQLYNSFTDTPTERAILLSQSTSHTGAHLMQPRSEAYEIEDRCFRVSVARRLMLPHPVAANPAYVVQFCPNKSAAGVICNKPLDPKLHHCYGCRYGRRCGSQTCSTGPMSCRYHSITQWGQSKQGTRSACPPERARMDLVFNLRGSITYLDVSIVAPFSCNPSLVAAASTKPGLMAKRERRRPSLIGIHTSILSHSSLRQLVDPVHMPRSSSITCCEMLTTHQLLSETPGPPSRAFSTVPSPNNNLWLPLRDPRSLLSPSCQFHIVFAYAQYRQQFPPPVCGHWHYAQVA